MAILDNLGGGAVIIPVSVKDGGTGATTKEQALENLGGEPILISETNGSMVTIDSFDGACEVGGLVHNVSDLNNIVNRQGTHTIEKDITSGTIVVTNTVSSTWDRILYTLTLLPNTEYTVSCYKETTLSARSGIICNDRSCISNSNEIIEFTTTTDSSGTLEMQLFTNHSENGITNSVTFSNLQIEIGSEAHPYVPYGNYEVVSCGNNILESFTENEIYSQYGNALYGVFPMDIKKGTSLYLSGKGYPGSSYYTNETFFGYQRITIADDGVFEVTMPVLVDLTGGLDRVILKNYAANTKHNFSDIQIEFGTESTDYEPYISDTFTVTPETEKAYLKTYDGVTNVFTDYGIDLSVKYGATENGAKLFEGAMVENRGVKNAETLAIPRKINGVDFDGSKDISIYSPLYSGIVGMDGCQNGWYKVGTATPPKYNDAIVTLLITAGAGDKIGIISFRLRTNEDGICNCTHLNWLARYGYGESDFICVVNGGTADFYVRQLEWEYARTHTIVIDNASRTSRAGFFVLENSTSITTNLTPTVTATDGSIVYSAKKLGGKTESELNVASAENANKLGNKTESELNVASAESATNSGIQYKSPITSGTWCKIAHASGMAAFMLTISFKETYQKESYSFYVGTAYQEANIIKLGSASEIDSPSVQIRIVQTTGDQYSYDIEILNDYNNATSMDAHCRILKIDGMDGSDVSGFTNLSEHEEGEVIKTITC